VTTARSYAVEAYNTATASANKIHDDDVARAYGFRGGLVPGVDVYAYLTRAPVERWGASWLAGGSISVRFDHPVYDGERVVVTATGPPNDTERVDEALNVVLTDPSGTVCATATAMRTARPDERPVPPAAPLPQHRPPACAETLTPDTTLGSLTERLDVDTHRRYLDDVRETLPLYLDEPCVHPGWLLRSANRVLAMNVELGPWIHVASDVALLRLVRPWEELEVRGTVIAERERKGHRFVELDVAVLAGGAVAQRIHHTAIHTPRRS